MMTPEDICRDVPVGGSREKIHWIKGEAQWGKAR